MDKHLILPIALLLFFSSCASYRVEGTTNVPSLNGQKLYLKVPFQDKILEIDSCEIIHGQFCMNGEVDSVLMGSLYIGDESLMPIVLEKGKIKISIENSGLNVSGTRLNENLYSFINSKNLLEQKLIDLQHKQMQSIIDGISADEAEKKMQEEVELLVKEMNQLIVKFVTDNFDNLLSVQIFSMYCQSFPTPIINSTIQQIIDKAPASFMEVDFVKEYLKLAKDRE